MAVNAAGGQQAHDMSALLPDGDKLAAWSSMSTGFLKKSPLGDGLVDAGKVLVNDCGRRPRVI